jgi:hypothetical protein
MATIQRAYGTEWCPELPDVRDGALWWNEVFKPHDWIDPTVYEGLLSPVTDEEMKITLGKQGGTAPGPSGVTRNMLQNGGESGVQMLRDAYDLILTSGDWPREMLLGLIFPICKKEGPCVVTNARPITLTETATKGLTGILAARLKIVLTAHPWMEHSQLAFLPGVDIMDNVEVDSFMWENARRTNTPLHVAYMDCSKAYDSMKKWHTKAALRAV